MAYNGELTMPFYPPVQEDQNREEGMPSIADKFGGDVIVMRVGSKPLSKATIQLAAKAIRSSKRHS